MKAISVEAATAFAIRAGSVDGIMAKRSVPREIVGRKMVLHAKRAPGRDAPAPAHGCGYITFGEAVPQLNGDCWWPIASFEPWATMVPAPARSGFWSWSYKHG
jgi:hypothetical protein